MRKTHLQGILKSGHGLPETTPLMQCWSVQLYYWVRWYHIIIANDYVRRGPLKLIENLHSAFCNNENLNFLFCTSICFALLPHWFNDQLFCFLYSALLLRTTFPICKNSLPLNAFVWEIFFLFIPAYVLSGSCHILSRILALFTWSKREMQLACLNQNYKYYISFWCNNK